MKRPALPAFFFRLFISQDLAISLSRRMLQERFSEPEVE